METLFDDAFKEVNIIMMRPNPYLLLVSALNFSLNDLDANRRGKLSPTQIVALEQRRLHEMELCTLGLIILILSSLILEIRLVVMLFVAACLVSLMIAIEIRYEEDIRGGVEMVSGRLNFEPNADLLSRYHIQVDDQDFRVRNRIKGAFDGQHRYRLYYTAASRVILSAEVA